MMRYQPDWLDLVREDAIDPDLPIIDAHHHLYDDPVRNATMGRFLVDEFLSEIAASGHNVVSTVYVEAYKSFLDAGPEELRSVGETRRANSVAEETLLKAPGGPRLCEGIVCNANLMLGERLGPVLDVHHQTAPRRLRGLRDHTASDPDVEIPYVVPEGMMRDPAFLAGVRCLAERDLSWDVYVFHPQLPDVAAVAAALPNLRIVLDHVGAPLAVGRFKDRAETFKGWRVSLADVARLPNVNVKLAGMLADYVGGDFEGKPKPPTSEEVLRHTQDYYRAAIDLFGPDRCMFASNFPRDRVAVSYGVTWNVYKRIAAGYSDNERAAMFHGTAARVYRLKSPEDARRASVPA